MAKLSEVFLHILGSTLEGMGGMTPEVKAQLALQQSDNSRRNLSALADLNSQYTAQGPGFVGPHPQGSFTPSPNDLSNLGVSPGTSYEPISRMVTTPVLTPGKTSGSSSINYNSRPIARGETITAPINTLSPYAALLGHQMGFQKDQFDKYDSDMHTNITALQGATSGLPKGAEQGIIDAVSSGLGIPSEFTQSPEYQAKAALIQKFTQGYNEAKKNRDAVLANAGGQSGSGGAPSQANPATRPPPPAALSNPPLGHMAVWNKITNSYGFIPQANFNPALHEQVGQQPIK